VEEHGKQMMKIEMQILRWIFPVNCYRSTVYKQTDRSLTFKFTENYCSNDKHREKYVETRK